MNVLRHKNFVTIFYSNRSIFQLIMNENFISYKILNKCPDLYRWYHHVYLGYREPTAAPTSAKLDLGIYTLVIVAGFLWRAKLLVIGLFIASNVSQWLVLVLEMWVTSEFGSYWRYLYDFLLGFGCIVSLVKLSHKNNFIW